MKPDLINKLEKIIEFLSETPDQSSKELSQLENAIDKVLATTTKETKPTINMSKNNDIIHIWSDGACSGNPGPGGWGTIVEKAGERLEFSGGSRRTTNNIMELTGALEGIRNTPEGSSIVLTSDSQYLVKGMTEWISGWKRKSWKKADGKALLNKDIWLQLDFEAGKRSIQWRWIKGHAGHEENERCDELARQAIQQ